MTLSAMESFESSLAELESNCRTILSLESFIHTYSVENMVGADLDMAIHYIDTVLEANGLSDDYSFEAEEAETTGTVTSPTGQSKGEKVKKFAEGAIRKMKEKLKTLPDEIRKYADLVMETLSGSSKTLSNTAKQILDKLDSVENTQSKITGNYSLFKDVRPQAAVASITRGIVQLGDQGKKALDVVGKITEGASSTLTLYNAKGAEFKFDGTSKFFDTKVESTKVEINGLSKTDVKLVCDNVIKLAESIDSAKEKLPKVGELVKAAVAKAGTTNNSESGKAAMALGSFYRSIVGGYIKYTIKISKLALSAANGSIKMSEKVEGK